MELIRLARKIKYNTKWIQCNAENQNEKQNGIRQTEIRNNFELKLILRVNQKQCEVDMTNAQIENNSKLIRLECKSVTFRIEINFARKPETM